MTIATEEISVGAETVLQLPGLVATRTGLVVFEAATDAQLVKAFGQICRMDGSLAWWIGDLGIAMQERKRKRMAAEAADLRRRAKECSPDYEGQEVRRQLLEKAVRLENHGVIEYTHELCAAHDISEGHVMNCVMLARFYSPSDRYEGLTPKHHQVAMTAARGARGEVSVAKIWLDVARAERLTASEQRKRVNLARATSPAEKVVPEPLAYAELIAADRWAVHYCAKVPELSHAQAVRMHTLMQGLRELSALLEKHIEATVAA